MTDRHAGYVVTLEEDIREDDAVNIVMALGQIRGVLSVEPIVSNPGLMIATVRAKSEIGRKLIKLHADLFK